MNQLFLQLDSFTILVAGCSLLVLMGALCILLWARDRTSSALLWWGVPFILGGAALVFYMRPGWDTDFVSIAFGNAARMCALGCLWQGIRVFQNRPPALLTLATICAIWLALCFYPDFVSNMAARIAVVSLLNSLLCALAALELFRDRGEKLNSRWPSIVVFGSFSLLMFVRACLVGVAPFPVGALPLDPLWLGIFMWLVFGHATFGAVLFIGMIWERREAAQRSYAMQDPLTGLLNRRAFADFADRMSRRRAGLRNAMAILVLDLDHFKSINDRFGHEAGDRMLKAFGDMAEQSIRTSDQMFRMGGEEFCVLLPDTSVAEAVVIAERIRQGFEAVVIETSAGPAHTTVSIGVAATQYAVEIDVLLAAADAAVYEAKARGRNRVVVAEPASMLRASLSDVVSPARTRA